MKPTPLLTTVTAAALAFALSACDQQQADSGDQVPMQQQGAVPAERASEPAAAETASQPAQPETTLESPLPDSSSNSQ